MTNLKPNFTSAAPCLFTRLKQLSLLTLCLSPLTAFAHLEKNIDLNGGHYDYYGEYHCHQQDCRQAPSRYSFSTRLKTSINTRDQEDFYNKDDWPHWMMVSQCQTVRIQILEATSVVPVSWTNPRNCEIREGKWTDPYTGDEFVRAARLEIDHIIPLSYANAANGYQWDDQKRMQFANDPLNLIPVGRDINRKKRDRGIGSWRPPEENYHCEYAAAWRDVSTKYDLDLFVRDRSRVNNILEDCDIAERDFEDESLKREVRVNGIPLPL